MRRKLLILIFVALFAFFFGVLLGYLTQDTMTEDERFNQYTNALFQSQIVGNTINLHYTLSQPEAYGIRDYPVTLGEINAEGFSDGYAVLENEQTQLGAFDYKALSQKNRLTYDILNLTLETDLLLKDHYLLTEYLSPTLGIQAQLPILLAEYPFRCKQDVEDYLELLSLTDSYFAQILDFEQVKSDEGLFMNADTAAGIIEQCRAFIQNPDKNYLLGIFEDKMASCEFLSEKKKSQYQEEHAAVIKDHLIPAYESLIDGIGRLQNTGVNSYGLCYFPDGREYYEYQVKSITGIYDSIPLIEERLRKQLAQDFFRMQRLLKTNPNLASAYDSSTSLPKNLAKPEGILTDLQEQMSLDFPGLNDTDYEVKYVHPDLKDHLSPAFYLTPPFDTLSPNSIYLNTASDLTGVALYTTLAHEGFPGHLYQSQYFGSSGPDPLRYLLNVGGYVEGWATYIERYAYQYAPVDREMGEMLWLNRSMNLCLYSLMDIGVHYYGWTPEHAGEFLSTFGISDQDAVREIYQCILEDPANYLQYYVGCLYFMDLQESIKEQQGREFDLLEFHKKILDIGPAQFPVLEKYLSVS